MSKFDELKKLAEAATPGPWVLCKYGSVMADATNCAIVPAETGMQDNLFIAAANPAAILELLAIQAQLVEALKLTLPDIETAEDIQRNANKKGSRHVTKARIVRAALAAAGAQP